LIEGELLLDGGSQGWRDVGQRPQWSRGSVAAVTCAVEDAKCCVNTAGEVCDQ
jgi:hypothetical protein